MMEDSNQEQEGDPQYQHAIQQQHLMIEQQRHEELMRMQQTAMVEQQFENQEIHMSHHLQEEDLYHLQQEMLRQSMNIPPPGAGSGMLPPGTTPTMLPPAGSNVQPPGTTSTMLPPGVSMGSEDMMPPGTETVPHEPFNRQLMAAQTHLRGPLPSMMNLAPPGGDGLQDHDEPKLPSLLSLKVEPPVEVKEVKLPMALEQALAFKTERAKQVGVDPYESPSPEPEPEPLSVPGVQESVFEMEPEDEQTYVEQVSKPVNDDRTTRNKRKKKKKKRSRNQQPKVVPKKEDEETGEKEEVEIEYIQETLGFNDLEPMYRQFARIFESFRIVEPQSEENVEAEKKEPVKLPDLKKVPKLDDDYEEEDDEKKEDSDKPKMSKRKLKKLTRLSVAELKQLVQRPDVVEMHDVTARDPKLLVQLKAHRNTVPVPRHWCFKRKYLQGKRGIEKPPFDLPEFIKKTGIMEMRAALQEKEDQRTLKAKMRERARPKLGKIDIDYQKLHDAFFKWQTKPRMSIHGDLYYEGKEFETRLKEKKPGDLSEDLRTALGMPVGQSAHKVPPPWLIAMQRYGPPPSYPNLKIPGLNAPIPDSCSFGYHAGGWGKPPVDETGRPLYGDVFGVTGQNMLTTSAEEEIDRTIWGELESESEEESEEEEEEEEEGGSEREREDDTGLVTPAEGLVTPSGITSIPAGMETPEIIELRKRKIESEMEGGETPVLFQVLPEKRMDRMGNAMMASTHIYDMTGGGGPQLPSAQLAPPRRTQGEGMVELALDPSELDLDNEAMAVRYEQQIREQQSQLQKEDLSDMLADHVARQKNKRKQRQQHQDSKQAKKYKEFKF